MELAQQDQASDTEAQVLELRLGKPSCVKNIDQALQLDVLPHCPGILIGEISMQGI
jgi:hypothetical protein